MMSEMIVIHVYLVVGSVHERCTAESLLFLCELQTFYFINTRLIFISVVIPSFRTILPVFGVWKAYTRFGETTQ